MPKLSVIVTFYNVAAYVDCALASLKAQTYDDFEVIIVDDGSTDNTNEKIVPWLEENPNFQLIQQENRGLGGARNAGVEHASGAYIAFLDGDDTVKPEMYEEMMAIAGADKSDVVICGYTAVFAAHSVDHLEVANYKTVFDFEPYAWNKLYRRELFVAVLYPEHLWYEDIPTTYMLLLQADKISVMQACYYVYDRTRVHSIQNSHDDRIYELNDSLSLLYAQIEAWGLLSEFSQELEYLFIFQALFLMTPRICYNKGVRFWEVAKNLKRQQQFVESYFPDWRENTYFLQDKQGIFKQRLGRSYKKTMSRLGGWLWWFAIGRIVLQQLIMRSKGV